MTRTRACPEYDRAVVEIFGKANNPKAMVRHWNELIGYLIQPRRNIPLIVILLGGGDNGKTVMIRTVMRLLGSQLVHAQRVEDLDKNRFAMGSLFGKLLFVDDDVRAGARLPDGVLKTISEAKEVTGELKYQPVFNFVGPHRSGLAVQQHSLLGRPVPRDAAAVDGHSV